MKPECKECGNSDASKMEWRGKSTYGKRFKCKVCGKWGNTGEAIRPSASPDFVYSNKGDAAEITVETEDFIKNEKDLVKLINLDEKEWMIDRFTVGKSAANRKDRSVEWLVKDGKVLFGEVHDSGKLLIKPLFSVKVWLIRKTTEIRNSLAVQDLKDDVAKFSQKFKQPKIKYPRLKEGLLFEVEMPDIHLGKLTWEEESGESSDLKSQKHRVITVLNDLLLYAHNYPIERILLPIGNDFFNVDNQFNTTSAGTPQQEDTRWRKTYRTGRLLAEEMVNLCSQIAPVDVLIVPGNHDEERSFYLGDALEARYSGSKSITINNSPKKRKYYVYGKVLIGLTHGYHEKYNKLPNIMATEVPDLWYRSRWREWHLGDKHHKEDMLYKTNEEVVTIRLLRSLTPNDAWHYDKGYVGHLHASEAFLWSKNKGLIAQFTSTVDTPP